MGEVCSYLVPLSGPAIDAIPLQPKPGGLVIGRHAQCDVPLPGDAEKVSRFHARLDHDGARWHVADLGSRWGTFVNGIKLGPEADTLLSDGDLIRINPWTFTLSPTARRRAVVPAEDMAQTIVRTVVHDTSRPMADTLLALLLESAGAIHAAGNEQQLAELLIDAAVRGTGMQNAALLRPIDSAGGVEVILAKFAAPAASPPQGAEAGASFSRSLIAAASQGVVAELGGSGAIGGGISQSIVQLKISSAICVPLMLGNTVAAYLYLDSRGSLPRATRPGASAFCVALGKMASLALANLKRVEMEKRDAAMRAELAAAAAAQKWIMPRRQGQFGPFCTIGESKPGQYVGGDFFDIIPLENDKLAVAVGDVCGKGISASVLMTATQGYLNAVFKAGSDPGVAVSAVNAFVNPRRPEGKFVTMWVGVFDPADGTLRYVDAGHSYAVLQRKDGSFQQLDRGGGMPIGLEPNGQYHAEVVRIEPGEKVMVVSDGIVEQFGMAISGAAGRSQFQVAGLQQAMSQAGDDEVADLFEAVIKHAGTSQLSDDATAVLVKWR